MSFSVPSSPGGVAQTPPQHLVSSLLSVSASPQECSRVPFGVGFAFLWLQPILEGGLGLV